MLIIMGTTNQRPRRPPRGAAREAAPAPVQVADSLSFLINKLAQLAGRGMAAALEPLGIQPRESGILAALAQFGPLPQQRLGELLVIDRTTMVLSIDRLEELELVERAAAPTDRRVYMIHLTHKGRAAVGDSKRRLDTFEADLLAPLSQADGRRFREALLRVVSPALDPMVRGPLRRQP